MKVIVIGAEGTIGKMIIPFLKERHEVITAGRTTGDIKVDISDIGSVENLYLQIHNTDAVICLAGDSVSTELLMMTDDKYVIGLQQKLLGQIHLVLTGLRFINNNGSFTLISGKTGEQPAKISSGKAVANGAVNSFVLAASKKMPRGIRINVISPSKVTDVQSNDLANAFIKSIETDCNGEIIRIGY